MKPRPILWMVIPCYNEEKVLPVTAPLFLAELKDLCGKELISENSKILFVNDGSGDSTWDIIRDLAKADPHYIGICQSRNRGHQSAVLAGLMEAKDQCDITISIDCDGQDDIHAMEEMVRKYLDGFETVYGVRSSRETDTWFKRASAESFYRLMKHLGAEVIFNHADYRLVSNEVLRHFADYEEVHIFLRGLFPLVGFPSTTVSYRREKRLAGESHYPLKKMLFLAIDGITSLSTKPISIIAGCGIVFSFLGLLAAIWAVIEVMLGNTVAGWASLICLVCILGGIQLLSLGVIGEYVGKAYLEAKRRPRFIISERTWKVRQRHWIEEGEQEDE